MFDHITRRRASVASIALLLALAPIVGVIVVDPASAATTENTQDSLSGTVTPATTEDTTKTAVVYRDSNNNLKYETKSGQVADTGVQASAAGPIVDFDSDGRKEMVYKEDGTGILKYVDFNGNVKSTGVTVALGPQGAVDWDDDGKIEVIVGTAANGDTGRMEGVDSSGETTLIDETPSFRLLPTAISGAGDINEDGEKEIAYFDDDGSLDIKIVTQSGNITTYGSTNSVGSIVDFNGDGDVELVHQDATFPTKYVDYDGNVGSTGYNADAPLFATNAVDWDDDGHIEQLYKIGTSGLKGVDKNGDVLTLNTGAAGIGGVGTFDSSFQNGISGTVTTQDGIAVQNATIQLIGVDFDNISAPSPSKLNATAQDLLDNATDPIPKQWDPNQAITGSGGVFETDNRVVAVHEASDWQGSPTLSNPLLQVDANEPIALSVWDPDAGGLVQDGGDSGLPGRSVNEGPVVIEELGPTGEVTSSMTVDLYKTWQPIGQTGIADTSIGDEDKFAQAALDAGFYRIYPEGTPQTSYVIVAGNPQSIAAGFESDLRSEANQLTSRASWIRDQLQQDKFYKETVSTDALGRWSADLPLNVKLVGVSAYKGPVDEFEKDPQNITRQDLRDLYNNVNLTQSLYLPTGVERVKPPESNLSVTLREASAPDLGNISAFDERFKKLRGLFENRTEALEAMFQNGIQNISRPDLEGVYTRLESLSENNQRLRQRMSSILNRDRLTEEDVKNLDLNVSDATDAQLRERIGAMEQALDELRNTIPTETSASTSAQNVTSTATFPGTIASEDVEVLAHFSNGTTRPVGEEFITVSQSTATAIPGQGATTVEVAEYPLGDANSVQFEWVAARESGFGTATQRVTNPTTNADPPDVEAVVLSSLSPGPDDPVAVTLDPAEDSSYRALSSVDIFGPDGSRVTPGVIQNGKRVNFTTAGEGRHTVQLTYNDTSGNQWTRTVHVGASSVDRNRPASLKASSGPTGLYALAADGLDGGSVSKEASRIAMTAEVAESRDVPPTIHAYTQEVSEDPTGTVALQVQRTDGKSVSTRSEVVMHTTATAESGTYVYRNGVPVTTDGTVAGSVKHMDNQTLIRTYTGETGSVSVQIVQPQGLADEAYQYARYQAATLQLQLRGLTSSLSGLSLGWLVVVTVPAGALGLRRRQGGNGGAAA